MRLVVDTSVLVGELLRVAGRTRLGDKRIELFLPEQMWGETQVELPRRIAAFIHRRSLEPALGTELAAACLAAIEANIVILDESIYAALEDEVRERSLTTSSGVFGSYGRGTAGVGSDLDLLLILQRCDEPIWNRLRRWDTSSLPLACDLLVYSLEEWRSLPQWNPKLAEALLNDTRWLWELPAGHSIN